MKTYIKNSVLVATALYAVFAAVVGVFYVANGVTQDDALDWLLKGLFITLIVCGLNVVLGLIMKRN